MDFVSVRFVGGPIPADEWNEEAARLRKAWPLRGKNSRIERTAQGSIISASAGGDWPHPWQVSASFEENEKTGEGEWRARLIPGFCRNKDAYIGEAALTDQPEPFLVLKNWRNPIASAGLAATSAGDLRQLPGLGYPPFFAALGVRPSARAGSGNGAADDESRTREIRAADIVLTQPRIGTRIEVDVLQGAVDAQIAGYSTVYSADYFRATKGRAKLRATALYTPPAEHQTGTLFGLELANSDTQYDELKIATVWMVSPPDAAEDAEPDVSWTPYPQHFCWWNLQHATHFVPPAIQQGPVRLETGIPLADFLGNQELVISNQQLAEVEAFVKQGDTRGIFWST